MARPLGVPPTGGDATPPALPQWPKASRRPEAEATPRAPTRGPSVPRHPEVGEGNLPGLKGQSPHLNRRGGCSAEAEMAIALARANARPAFAIIRCWEVCRGLL